MKCPKSFEWGQAFECLREDCAWWDEYFQRCDPTGLLPHIKSIEETLAKIKEKMPHELQFRKI